MERLITSFLVSLVMALGLLLLLGAPRTLADEPTGSSDTSSSANTETIDIPPEELNDTSSLDVSDILSTKGQAQSYLNDPQSSTPIVAFMLDIINFITRVIGVICMVFIIVGGLRMIVSEGEDSGIQKGKEILTAAIIGLVIVMFSYILVRFFQSIFYLDAPPPS